MDKIREVVISKFQSTKTPSKAINVEVQIEEKGSYPPWAKKAGGAVMFVWDKCLWGPFRKGWRFLERWTNLTFWIFTGIVVGVLVIRKHHFLQYDAYFHAHIRLDTFNQSSPKRLSHLERLSFAWSRSLLPHWSSPRLCLVLLVSDEKAYLSINVLSLHEFLSYRSFGWYFYCRQACYQDHCCMYLFACRMKDVILIWCI